jgi:hypothetical protein
LSKDDVISWMDPFDKAKTAPEEAIQTGSSLGFLENRSGKICLASKDIASSFSEFSDQAHRRLCDVPDDDADAVMFEALAWIIASIEQQNSTSWLNESTAKELAGKINEGLPDLPKNKQSEDRRFNDTKLTPWKRWIEFLGLGFDTDLVGFYPAIAGRLKRELTFFDSEKELGVNQFLGALAKRMPYIDGGSVYGSAVARLRLTRSPPRLSRVLSTALRELHDEKILELRTLGDAANAISLWKDSHEISSVLTVRLKGPSNE